MRYLVAALLIVGAHFGMGALIPATNGQSSWLVPLANNSDSWLSGLGHPGAVSTWLGILAVVCFGAALLGVFGWFVTRAWVRPAIILGIVALIAVYGLYFTAWALLPIGLSIAALCGVAVRGWPSKTLPVQTRARRGRLA